MSTMENKPQIPAKTFTEALQRADIALDSYDDIFSDFDPSPYEKRLLSEDFIYELRRRYAATGKGEFMVNLTLPKALRSDKVEGLVKKRIKEHFKSRVREIERRTREKARNGAIRLIIGILLAVGLFSVPEFETVPLMTIFSVLIWYSIWSGLESVLEASSSLGRKKAFAEKFMKAEYNFFSQEDVIQSIQGIHADSQMPEGAASERPGQP